MSEKVIINSLLEFSHHLQSNQGFEDCEFTNLDFSDFKFISCNFIDCKFVNCNLSNQILTNLSMRCTDFINCNLLGINWTAFKRLESITYFESKLSYSIFQNMKVKNFEFNNCLLLDVDFSGADLSQSKFINCSCLGSSFERSILNGADFRTATGYAFDIRTTKIKGAKFSYPSVLALITALGAEIE